MSGLIALTDSARATSQATPGAAQFASPFACRLIARLARRERPQRVLEVGAGYGTLTAILAAVCPQATIVSIEDDPDCRVAVRARMAWAPRWAVCSSDDWCAENIGGIDLLVLDGGDCRPDYFAHLQRGALVIVEGGRRGQRAVLENELHIRRRPYAITSRKPLDRSKGVWLYRLNPTAWERLGYAVVRGVEIAMDMLARGFGHPIGKRRAIRL